jgi:uncharacterized membrane protein YhaH (DUF805 family)
LGREIFWPGVLGLLGTISPIVYLVNYLLSINALMDASSYGAGSPLTVIFVIPFIVIIVVGFFAMSLLFFVYRARAVVLGGILAVLYGLPLYGLVPNQFHQLSSACCGQTPDSSWALSAAESVPLAVGLAGGVWGFFATTRAMSGQNPVNGTVVPRLIIAMGALSMIGFFSVVGSFQSQPFLLLDAAIFLGGPVGVMVSGALLYTGRWRTKALGILIVVGSLPSVMSSLFLVGNGVQWYFPSYAPGLISLLASGLALILGLRVMGSKRKVLTSLA